MAEQPVFLKRLYIYMKRLFGHGWQLVNVAILGVYSLFTLFASEEAQRRFLMAIHMDPQQKVALWLALICVFLLYAGFRAWDEEYARAERNAESGIASELQRVSSDLNVIKDREWPRLTAGQISELIKRLREIGPYMVWIVRPNNHDCIALAADFNRVFRDAGWNVPHEPYAIEEQTLGLTIQGNVAQEPTQRAIAEATGLPAAIYVRRKEDAWTEELVIVSVGPKEPSL